MYSVNRHQTTKYDCWVMDPPSMTAIEPNQLTIGASLHWFHLVLAYGTHFYVVGELILLLSGCASALFELLERLVGRAQTKFAGASEVIERAWSWACWAGKLVLLFIFIGALCMLPQPNPDQPHPPQPLPLDSPRPPPPPPQPRLSQQHQLQPQEGTKTKTKTTLHGACSNYSRELGLVEAFHHNMYELTQLSAPLENITQRYYTKHLEVYTAKVWLVGNFTLVRDDLLPAWIEERSGSDVEQVVVQDQVDKTLGGMLWWKGKCQSAHRDMQSLAPDLQARLGDVQDAVKEEERSRSQEKERWVPSWLRHSAPKTGMVSRLDENSLCVAKQRIAEGQEEAKTMEKRTQDTKQWCMEEELCQMKNVWDAAKIGMQQATELDRQMALQRLEELRQGWKCST